MISPEENGQSKAKGDIEPPPEKPVRIPRSTLLPAVDIMHMVKRMRKDDLIDEDQTKQLSDMVVNGDMKLIVLVKKHQDPDVPLTRNQQFSAALIRLAAKRANPVRSQEDKAAAAKTRLQKATRSVTLADWALNNMKHEEGEMGEEGNMEQQWRHA